MPVDDIEIMRLAALAAADRNAEVPRGLYGRAGEVIAGTLEGGRVVLAVGQLAPVVLTKAAAEQAITALLGATGHLITQLRRGPA